MIVTELPDAPSPQECCARFTGVAYRLLVDSAGDEPRLNRYSYFCADPQVVLTARGRKCTRTSSGHVAEQEGDIVRSARELLRDERRAPLAGLPPFQGGLAGYLGYELGGLFEDVPRAASDDIGAPDAVLALYDWVIAWSHAEARAWLISTGMGSTDPLAARLRADAVLSRLSATHLEPPTPMAVARAPFHVESNFTREAYLAAVGRARELIFAGDIYQVNLSQRFSARVNTHPLALHAAAREANASPFGAYFEGGDITLISASPERFLSVGEDGRVEARPIKGTRPRGATPAEDDKLASELLASEKDRAENVMIVDLLRNDISRVCATGSVRVPELFTVERYATVMHLVSSVTGQLAAGRDTLDLLAASFPGGSITGAPKVRAMEIIAELEPVVRGPYCGSLVLLGASGTLDSSILIRTMIQRGDRVWFSAGGGIVADSDPAAEYEETLHKAAGMIRALEAVHAPGATTMAPA